MDVKAQNQAQAVEKAYTWLRGSQKGDLSFEVRRSGTTVQLENPKLDLMKILSPE